MSHPAILAEAIGLQHGEVWLYRDVTLELPAGRVAGVVAADGAARRALAQTLLARRLPQTGRLRVAGHRPEHYPQVLHRAVRPGGAEALSGMSGWSSVTEILHGAVGEARRSPSLREVQMEITRLGMDQWARERISSLPPGAQTVLGTRVALAHPPIALVLDLPEINAVWTRHLLRVLERATDRSVAVVVLASRPWPDADLTVYLDEGYPSPAHLPDREGSRERASA